MDVTIIGTGNMARGIATRLLAGGHGITLLGTGAGKAEDLAGELGGSVDAGTVGDEISGVWWCSEASGAVGNLTGRTPRSLWEVFEAHRGELMQGVSA